MLEQKGQSEEGGVVFESRGKSLLPQSALRIREGREEKQNRDQGAVQIRIDPPGGEVWKNVGEDPGAMVDVRGVGSVQVSATYTIACSR
jgi:hypothetical protein